MNRAERRRLDRFLEKEEVTYTFTNRQLQEMKDQMRRELGEEMENRFIKLFFSMPIVVGHEKYGWDNDQCLQVAEDLCDEYAEKLMNPTTEMVEKYCKKMTKLTGVKFERR